MGYSGKESIILVNVFQKIDGDNEGAVNPPLGLMYLASSLEQDGYNVGILDARLEKLSVTATLSRIKKDFTDPFLIGFYINSFNQRNTQELAHLIKQDIPAVVLVGGGPVPTVLPETVLDTFDLDYIVRGEGELVLRALMQRLQAGVNLPVRDVPGVIPKDKSVPLSSRAERIQDLDRLPFPAYHLLGDIRQYSFSCRGIPAATLITSRGCYYSCDFCSKDVFGNNVTRRSVGNVIQEIQHLIQKYGIKQINFVDDNLTNKREFFESFLDELIRQNFNIWFNVPSGIRSEILDAELLAKMKKAGFYSLAFGVETADQELLDLHKKRLNIKSLESKIALAKQAGFLTYGFFIIGLPGETEKSFISTLEFIRRVRLDMASFMIAIPFPGTEMLRMVKENGKLLMDIESGINAGYYGGRCFFSYPGLDPRDVERRYKTAYKYFFNFRRILNALLRCRTKAEFRWFVLNGLSVVKNLFAKR